MNNRLLSAVFTASLLLAPCAMAQSAAGTDLIIGQIETVSGSALLSRTGMSFSEAQVNTPVYARDLVETTAGSSVSIRFDDGSVLTLGENTAMEITDVIQPDSFHFYIPRGTFRCDCPGEVAISTDESMARFHNAVLWGGMIDGQRSFYSAQGEAAIKTGTTIVSLDSGQGIRNPAAPDSTVEDWSTALVEKTAMPESLPIVQAAPVIEPVTAPAAEPVIGTPAKTDVPPVVDQSEPAVIVEEPAPVLLPEPQPEVEPVSEPAAVTTTEGSPAPEEEPVAVVPPAAPAVSAGRVEDLLRHPASNAPAAAAEPEAITAPEVEPAPTPEPPAAETAPEPVIEEPKPEPVAETAVEETLETIETIETIESKPAVAEPAPVQETPPAAISEEPAIVEEKIIEAVPATPAEPVLTPLPGETPTQFRERVEKEYLLRNSGR